MAIRRVNPGDPQRAADFNALVDEVLRLGRTRSNPTAARAVERKVLAYIVSAPPEGERIMPGDCTYTYALFGNPNIEVSGVIPWKGRPVRSDGGPAGKGEFAIYPRPVGEPCWIHRVRLPDGSIEARLEVVTEQIAGAPCTPAGGAAVGGGGGPPEEEEDQPPGGAPISGDGVSGIGGADEVGRP